MTTLETTGWMKSLGKCADRCTIPRLDLLLAVTCRGRGSLQGVYITHCTRTLTPHTAYRAHLGRAHNSLEVAQPTRRTSHHVGG